MFLFSLNSTVKQTGQVCFNSGSCLELCNAIKYTLLAPSGKEPLKPDILFNKVQFIQYLEFFVVISSYFGEKSFNIFHPEISMFHCDALVNKRRLRKNKKKYKKESIRNSEG